MLLLTEKEAKKRWCPMVRCESLVEPNVASNRWYDEDLATNWSYSRCIASECMMWQWMGELEIIGVGEPAEEQRVYERGYCGLARRR